MIEINIQFDRYVYYRFWSVYYIDQTQINKENNL